MSLSNTEAETYAGVTCVQDILYVNNVLESLGLKVRLSLWFLRWTTKEWCTQPTTGVLNVAQDTLMSDLYYYKS